MDEKTWNESNDPQAMWEHLERSGKASERKGYLCGCALYRRGWHLLTDSRLRLVIETIERFVDGFASQKELEAVQLAAAKPEPWLAAAEVWRGQEAFQCSLLRDLYGSLPFRAVHLDLRLLTDAVKQLARAAYRERQLPEGTLDPQRLAVLADALEEAGAGGSELVGHLRQHGVAHIRGCWVVDLLLNQT